MIDDQQDDFECDTPLFDIRRKLRFAPYQLTQMQAHKLLGELERLERYLNTPEYEDFARGVVTEARHQLTVREEDDKVKTPGDWFWTLGYLANKALAAMLRGDLQKAKHHTITAAALLNNWHRAILQEERDRPPFAREGESPEEYAKRMAGI